MSPYSSFNAAVWVSSSFLSTGVGTRGDDMSIVSKLIGPQSKYDKSIPYTYEARVPIFEGDEEYNSYIADTICGLISCLNKKKITPDEVTIYEIFETEEKIIDHNLYVSKESRWLSKSELCQSFKEHYKGHIFEGGCSFEDRECD